jgi:hypothetical protein
MAHPLDLNELRARHCGRNSAATFDWDKRVGGAVDDKGRGADARQRLSAVA